MHMTDKKNNQGEDEITLEPELDSDNAKDPATIIKALKEKLKISEKERQEYLSGWQRAKADFVNARKDDEKSMAQFVKFSNERIISDIIPALDSFHSAFGDKAAWEKVDLNWRMGVQYIYSQLIAALQKSGVTLVDSKPGDAFDEGRHESVATVPGGTAGTIAEVVQKGYSLHGKLLQPAKVKIFE